MSGKSVGQHLRALNNEKGFQVFCGLQDAEIERTALMRKPPRPPDLGELNEYTQAAFLKPWSSTARINRDALMRAELPAANMYADARSLATLLYPLANDGAWPDGDTFLSAGAVEAALKERIRGDDLVLPFDLSWAAGLMRNVNSHFGPNKNAYGHAGSGGSCVVIDPERKLTAAYVMNKMSPHLVGDPRSVRLINAIYDAF